MMRQLLLVAIGGALGAAARYLTGLGAARTLGTTFPYGTLVVNVVGCGLIGLFAVLLERREAFVTSGAGMANEADALQADGWVLFFRYAVMIGFLGGLTTFSSFALDTLLLAQQGRLLFALGNIGLQLLIGLAAVWLGVVVTRAVL